VYSGFALLPTPLATTRRLLLPILVVLVVPLEAAPKDLAAPPSVSCLDADGERYLQGLLDRIHELESQLDAEMEARLTERAEADRKLQGVTSELTHQAAAALDPEKQPEKVEGFDPAQAKKELAALKAALDEATAARRSAEAEAAAASKTAVTFASAVEDLERRLAAAERRSAAAIAGSQQADAEAAEATNAVVPPAPEPSPKALAAEASPTRTPAAVSENERAAAQLAALTGNSAASPAPHEPPPAVASTQEPSPNAQAAEPSPITTPASLSERQRAAAQLAALSGNRVAPAGQSPLPAAEPSTTNPTTAVPESERAAAQLAALTGKTTLAPANPAAIPAPPKPVEVAHPPATAALGSIETQPARTRCDEPPETARIAPGDRLAIHVDHLREVSDTVEVGNDGRIHLPLVGSIPAAGRNQRELAADLTQRLTVYLQAPRVNVAVQLGCRR
jgi:Polysaccharide biosynthesis/export protein